VSPLFKVLGTESLERRTKSLGPKTLSAPVASAHSARHFYGLCGDDPPPKVK
jgi:hypothetical protein